MTSTQTNYLIELWERQEETDREKVEEEAIDEWQGQVEPEERQRYVESAEEEWDSTIPQSNRKSASGTSPASLTDGTPTRRTGATPSWRRMTTTARPMSSGPEISAWSDPLRGPILIALPAGGSAR
jgi:hypothetical protein